MAIEPRSLVAPGIYRSGQPTADEILAFAKEGGKTLIALNADGRLPEGEQAIAEVAGLKYIYSPLPGFAAPDHATVAGLLSIIRDKSEQPVWVKCRHGEDRTGTVIACLRIDSGWSADKAIEEAREHHMSWVNLTWFSPMARFIRRWKP